MNKTFKIVIPIILVLILSLGAYLYRDRIVELFFKQETPEDIQRGVEVDEDVVEMEDIEVILESLEIPWDMEFLTQDTMLVTERPGRLLYVVNGEIEQTFEIEDVLHTGEGGLLGVTKHPEFEDNGYIYIYLTVDGPKNRVERYRFVDEQLTEKETILENIPGDRIHNGGRIAFGPDGYLYITTGDAAQTALSQDTKSLAGKILRITDEGEVPSDNPFNNAIYSYGHRNPQGIAWDDQGRLWSVEHGSSAEDELNLIVKGGNYGWPEIRGEQTRQGMIPPVYRSGSDYTWAPSGLAYWDGSVFFTGLRGRAIYEGKIEGEEVESFVIHFEQEYGRIRAIYLGLDNMFYILTSNRDGRGSPVENDDRLVRINPMLFRQ